MREDARTAPWTDAVGDDYADLRDLAQWMTRCVESATESTGTDGRPVAELHEFTGPGGFSAILHPLVVSWIAGSLRRLRAGGPQAARPQFSIGEYIRDCVLASNERAREYDARYGLPADASPPEDLYSYRLAVATTKAQTDLTLLPTNVVLLRSKAAPEHERLKDAIDLLAAIWPEIHREVRICVRVLVFFDGAKASAFTDFDTLGTVYLNRAFVAVRPAVDVCELLVHEAAHVRLDSLLVTRPMVRASAIDVRFATPLQQVARPLAGVLQQAFVLSRLVRFYQLLGDRAPEHVNDGIRARHKEHVVGLAQCVGTLAANGEHLTDAGRSFIANMKAAEKASPGQLADAR